MTSTFTITRQSRKLAAVTKDGKWAGFLDRCTRTHSHQFHRVRQAWWEGTVDGVRVRGNTLKDVAAALRNR
jgi:nucleotidyltransferase/DNA polymerase involved in DNA repair